MRCASIFFVVLMVFSGAPAALSDAPGAAPPGVAPPQNLDKGQPPLELTLAESIALALQNNRQLINARLSRVTQKFDLMVAEDEFWPDVNVNSLVDYNIAWEAGRRQLAYNEGTGLFPTVTLRLPTGGSFSVGLNTTFRDAGTHDTYTATPALTFVQPLLKGGGTEVATANLQNARRREAINILAFKTTLINIVNTVISAYRHLALAKRQVDISARSLERAREQLAVNQLLIQTGRMAERDAIQTEADIANRELRLTETQNSLDAARLGLINVLDIDSRTEIDPTEPVTINPRSPDLAQSLDAAFTHRPDYLQALLGLENRKTDLIVAENNRLWDLSFSAATSATGSRQSLRRTLGSALGDVVNRGTYGIGLGLHIPLYGDLTRQQRVVRASTALEQAEHSLTELRQHIDIEVRNAVRDVAVRQRQVDLARRARDLAEQKVAIEQEKLKLGLSTNFQLVVFEDDLVRAYNNEVSTTTAYLNTLTAFDRTLGTTLETWNIDVTRMEQ